MLETLSTYSKDPLSLLSDFSTASIVAVLTTAALFGFALRYGKDRMIALILSLYIALLVFINFPYTEKLLLFSGSDFNIQLSNTIIFIAFVLISYIIVERVVWSEYSERGSRHFLEAFVLAISAAALLLAFSYNVLPIASFYTLAPPIELLFASSNLFFWWLVFPLVGVFLLGRH